MYSDAVNIKILDTYSDVSRFQVSGTQLVTVHFMAYLLYMKTDSCFDKISKKGKKEKRKKKV